MKLPNLCNCLRLDYYYLCTVYLKGHSKPLILYRQKGQFVNPALLKVEGFGENGQSEITKDLLNIIKVLMNATQDLLIATYAKYNIIP